MMQTTSDHGKTPEHAPLQLVSSTSTVLPHTALAGGEFSASPSTNSECLAVLVGSTVQILLSAVLAREDGLNTVSVTPSAASMHNQWVQTSECDRASSVGHAQPHTSTATLRSFSNGLEEGKAVTPKVISHWTFGFCTFVPQFLNPITVVGTVRLHGLRLRYGLRLTVYGAVPVERNAAVRGWTFLFISVTFIALCQLCRPTRFHVSQVAL
jgi:hypothetical protein